MRRALVLFLMVLAVVGQASFVCAASAQPGKPADLTGSWRGAYSYVMTDGAPVNFSVTILTEGGWISGKISEPNTFGDKSSDQLYANIRGAVMEDGRVIFLKKYDGTGGVSHFVQYEGHLDQRQGTIRGKWTIRPDWWGTFQMTRQKP